MPIEPLVLMIIVLKTAGVCSSSRDFLAAIQVDVLSIENETNSNINRVLPVLFSAVKSSRVRVKIVELLVNFWCGKTDSRP